MSESLSCWVKNRFESPHFDEPEKTGISAFGHDDSMLSRLHNVTGLSVTIKFTVIIKTANICRGSNFDDCGGTSSITRYNRYVRPRRHPVMVLNGVQNWWEANTYAFAVLWARAPERWFFHADNNWSRGRRLSRPRRRGPINRVFLFDMIRTRTRSHKEKCDLQTIFETIAERKTVFVEIFEFRACNRTRDRKSIDRVWLFFFFCVCPSWTEDRKWHTAMTVYVLLVNIFWTNNDWIPERRPFTWQQRETADNNFFKPYLPTRFRAILRLNDNSPHAPPLRLPPTTKMFTIDM